jgi:hypothetical protein
MASINEPSAPHSEREAWNEAHDRLMHFLGTFELGDHARASELALTFLRQAQEVHRQDASRDPTTLTLAQAQNNLAEWLAANLDQPDKSPSHVLPTGYVALLLSRVYQTAPSAFLANPLPEELRQALRETLLVTGPDLTVSSMTPRHLDYGPMLSFAKQTWHRWDAREFFVALFFWAGVYLLFYWWLSKVL